MKEISIPYDEFVTLIKCQVILELAVKADREEEDYAKNPILDTFSKLCDEASAKASEKRREETKDIIGAIIAMLDDINSEKEETEEENTEEESETND